MAIATAMPVGADLDLMKKPRWEVVRKRLNQTGVWPLERTCQRYVRTPAGAWTGVHNLPD
jgi:hypothetical protein